MTNFNRFDITEAWYLALSHCHGGMGSEEYARLSAMSAYFRPAPSLSVETLTENGLAIYEAACSEMLGS